MVDGGAISQAFEAVLSSDNLGSFVTSAVTATGLVVSGMWAVVHHLLRLIATARKEIEHAEERVRVQVANGDRRAHARIDNLEATKLSRNEGELLLRSIERLEQKQDSSSTAQSARLDAILLAITGGGLKRGTNNSGN